MYADPPNSFTSAFRAAFLIGIDQYTEGLPSLSNAVRDVDAVADALERQHGFHVLSKLTNEQATLARIRSELAALKVRLVPDTWLLFYFAGHGISEPSLDGTTPQGFFIPHDAQQRNQQSFLPMSEVYATLRELDCHHMLIVLDCCFSGAFRFSTRRDIRPARAKMYLESFTRYMDQRAWQVITSTAPNETALDVVVCQRPLGVRGQSAQSSLHSPFAQALMEGLSGGADRSLTSVGDGLITASELHHYIEQRLLQIETTERHRQRSLLFSLPDGELGEFLFRVPGAPLNLPEAAQIFAGLNPYRGLRPYTSHDAKLFFGRSEAVAKVADLITKYRLTLLTGEMGVGKSSLVCAGLYPRFHAPDGDRSESRAWRVCPVLRPGPAPLQILQQLAHHLSDRRISDLSQAVTKVLDAHPQQQLLIAIDQLEELSAMCPAPAERMAFLDQLIGLLAIPRVHLLLVLRADAFPTLGHALCQRVKETDLCVHRLPPMSAAELREAIEGPARETALFFDPPTLIDTIIGDVIGSPGALALLSYTLHEMYHTYCVGQTSPDRASRTLTLRHYETIGGAHGVLQKTLDEVDEAIGAVPEASKTLRRILARMVSRKGSLIARRRVLSQELHYGDEQEDQRVQRVLEQLESRYLVISETFEGQQHYELAHDRLAVALPTSYLIDNPGEQPEMSDRRVEEWSVMVRAVNAALTEWQLAEHDPKRLWAEDLRLPGALTLLEKDRFRFNAAERHFLIKSNQHRTALQEQEQRNKRRKIQIVAAVALSSIIGFIASGLYFQQLRDSRRRSRVAVLETTEQMLTTIQKDLEPVVGTVQGVEKLLQSMSALVGSLDYPEPMASGGSIEASQGALSSQVSSIEHYLRLIDRDPAALRANLKVALSFGSLMQRQNRLEPAEQNLAMAVKIRAVLDRVAPLHGEHDLKTRSEEGRLRADTLLLRGQVQWARSEMAAAGASFTEYIREIRTLLHDDPDNRLLRHALMLGLERSGDVAMSRLAYAQARGEYWSALALARALAEEGKGKTSAEDHCRKQAQQQEGKGKTSTEDHCRDLIISYNNVGRVEEATGENEQAQKYFLTAHELTVALYKQHPNNHHYARDLLLSYGKLGDLAMAKKSLAAAKSHFDESIRLASYLQAQDQHNRQVRIDLACYHSKRGEALQEMADEPSPPRAGKPDSGERHKLLAAARQDFTAMQQILQELIGSEPSASGRPAAESRHDLQRYQSIAFKSLGELATASFEASCLPADHQLAAHNHAEAVRLREELVRIAEQQSHPGDGPTAAVSSGGPILQGQLDLITARLSQVRLLLAPCSKPPPDLVAAEEALCAVRATLVRYRSQFAQDVMVREVNQEVRVRCARLLQLQNGQAQGRGCCHEVMDSDATETP